MSNPRGTARFSWRWTCTPGQGMVRPFGGCPGSMPWQQGAGGGEPGESGPTTFTLLYWLWPAHGAMRQYVRTTPTGRLTVKPITDVHELFRYQRAIRNFTDEEVSDELVDQVLTAAIHGPSGSNTQPWHFIVIRDHAVKQPISEV